ncbi:MAG TPA: DUF1592 domain-containing protein [Polyangiaceae bacterium]|nr:DUF1592 domain-containing protein [Polyangiaceae bacterium]
MNTGVRPEPDASDAPDEQAPSDIASAPQRGGPNAPAVDDGLEASLDESPSVRDIIAVRDPSSVADGVALTNRFRRLTLDEYDRSVRDLLGFDPGPLSSNFPEELPTLGGYFARGDLRVTDRLIVELQNAAGRLAERAVTQPEVYASLAPCAAEGAACRDRFLTAFGLRAYRRPLTEAELARYQALFDAAGAVVGSGDAFRDGVQLSLEAMLDSPHFLYHVERGSGERDDEGERISGYEAASRLSYMLWGSMPDATLLAAAESGELSTGQGIAAHARRLVDDPKVAIRVSDYHSRWLQLGALADGGKDAASFPEYSSELVSSMRAETDRFIREATLAEGGSLEALLTAPYTFVDARLAALYGIEGEFGDELTRVELAPDVPRAGLLTQAAFLTGHSSTDDRTSPILRGVFVLRRLLCQDIPDPPPNAQSTEPPPSATPIVTTRDFFTWKTSMAECQGCHTQINPVGFAFEDFDAIGRHRSEEGGAAIDAKGVLNLAGTALAFEGGKELAAQIASRPEAQACYAQNWLRYLWGRADTRADLRTLATITQKLGGADYGVRELLLDVSASAAFSHLQASAD